MKKLISVLALLLLITITACNGDEPWVLPFDSHPSVLRGTWSGSISSYPADGDILSIVLRDLSPVCREPNNNNQCVTYDFTGTIQIGSGVPVGITGEVSSGDGIYALRTPPRSPSMKASFTADAVVFNLEASYWGNAYSGNVVVSGQPMSYNIVLGP
jgi:hypothetical protein